MNNNRVNGYNRYNGYNGGNRENRDNGDNGKNPKRPRRDDDPDYNPDEDNDFCCDPDFIIFLNTLNNKNSANCVPPPIPPIPPLPRPPHNKEEHRKHKKIPIKLSKREIEVFNKALDVNITDLDSLIKIASEFNKILDIYPDISFDDIKMSQYRFNSIYKISRMEKEMKEINHMIGMNKIKQQFVAQISYLLSEYKQDMLMHTVIYGPPGHGKTEIARLIGRAYHKSGILKSNAFVCANRSQLVGRYVGHTAGNTTKMFDNARGGVIFIDEAYSLGSKSESDSFSKEAIDTINQLLSERMDTMCIIAGYKKDLEECFFKVNQGLTSRFPWVFEIDKYTSNELYNIFLLYLHKGSWTLHDDVKCIGPDFFTREEKYFPNAGRDVFTFFNKCSITHSFRQFLKTSDKILTNEDIVNGIKSYKEHKKLDNNDDNDCNYNHMYI